jgi:hypothetical protein
MLYLFASNIEAKKIKGSILYTCWEGRERVREREREIVLNITATPTTIISF